MTFSLFLLRAYNPSTKHSCHSSIGRELVVTLYNPCYNHQWVSSNAPTLDRMSTRTLSSGKEHEQVRSASYSANDWPILRGKSSWWGVVDEVLKPMNLDSLSIKLQPFLLVHQEFLDVFALIPLKLDHLAHLGIVDDGAIASYANVVRTARRKANKRSRPTELLLNHLENFLLIELFGQSLHSSQGLTTIALCMLSHVNLGTTHIGMTAGQESRSGL